MKTFFSGVLSTVGLAGLVVLCMSVGKLFTIGLLMGAAVTFVLCCIWLICALGR